MKAPRIALALAVVMAAGGSARADYDPEWRDGCPGGNRSRTQDIQHRWADKLDDYPGTRPERVGALPQSDSALGDNQVGLDTMVARFASLGNGSGAASAAAEALHVHLNYPFARWLLARWAGGLNLAASAQQLEDGRTRTARLGNAVIQPEMRMQWVATGTNVVDSVKDPDHQAAGLRNGLALQLILAVPFDQGMSARAARASLWRREAFEGYLVSPRSTAGAAFEIRSEGVGCYAPFVHLRLSATFTDIVTDPAQSPREHMVWLAPQTLTVGVSPSSHASVMFQYGLLVYFTGETARGSPESLIGATTLHRFRIGGEYVWRSLTFSAHLDFFLGSTLYDGSMFGVSVNYHTGDWP